MTISNKDDNGGAVSTSLIRARYWQNIRETSQMTPLTSITARKGASRPTTFLGVITLSVGALTGSCLTMAQAASGSGESDVDTVEEVVVSSRTPDLIDQIGVSVSVLDQDTMLSLGYPDLASLLDTQPGVTVTLDGGYGLSLIHI